MDCPACGRDNADDHMECEDCNALLVDAFEPEDDGRTDPIQLIGGSESTSAETDELLRAAREVTEDDLDVRVSLERFETPPQYTGDLPRLFRFGNRYQILEKLGEGGMGRVYKALDLELDRAVALKTIRAEKGSNREVQERFKQELILARKVTHKNVIRIYDLGEYERIKFFTMELVEGASLREVLNDEHQLSVDKTLSFMKQMLAGLSEAHSQDVVHRDLKPQNIMVDGDGVVRIMDFGIARTADSATMTGTGEMMGTPDYISPEQVKGETADAQSDLYSCGVILYELLTGETPFKGDTPISRIVARIQVKAPSPRDLNPDIPPYLERIVLKCLEADPDLRYHSADEVLEDLAREQVDSSLWLRLKKTIAGHRGWVAAACAVGALGLGVWYSSIPSTAMVAADVPATTLAVLPFRNVTGDEDLAWMEAGIPEMLITDISQLRSLRPVTAERTREILLALGLKGRAALDDETVTVVTETAGADHALHGNIVTAGDELRLDLRLREVNTGVESRIKVQGALSDVFALVDSVTEQVTAALNVSESNRPLTEVSTSSVVAFRAYHEALSELSHGSNQAAIPLLEEAVELDPNFAMAYAKLAEANYHLGNEAQAKQAVRIARARIDEAPPPLAELYQIHAIGARVENDPETAVQSYRALEELYPDDPQILFNLASSLETMGQIDEAIVKYRDVLERDPSYGGALLGLGRMLVTNERPSEAIPILTQALDAQAFQNDGETLGMIHSILGVAHRDLVEFDVAVDELEKSLIYRRAANDSRGVSATLTNLAIVHGLQGRLQEARGLLGEALTIARATRNSTMESFALTNLGAVNEQSGLLRDARSNYSESLEIEWERKQHSELVDRLNMIGHVDSLLGRYADAMVYLEQAKVHIAASNDPKGRAFNLFNLGHIHRVKGHYKEAIEAFLGSIPQLQETGNLLDAAAAHDELSKIYADQGKYDEAQRSIRESLAASEALRIPARLARTKIHEARLHIVQGRLDSAERSLASAEQALKNVDRTGVEPLLQLVRGTFLRAKGDTSSAASALSLARELAVSSGHLELELEATLELARTRLDGRDVHGATELLSHVTSTLEGRRLRPLQAIAGATRAEAYIAQGKLDAALVEVEQSRAIAAEFDGARMVDRVEVLRRHIDSRGADRTVLSPDGGAGRRN